MVHGKVALAVSLVNPPPHNINAVVPNQYGRRVLHMASTGVTAAALLGVPGIDVNAVDDDISTPLHGAVWAGHGDVVAVLLATPGINVNARDMFERTPLHWAVVKGHFDIIAMLLATPGIDVNARDRFGFTPLHLAARERLNECVRALVAD